ncbi:hypothetical protein [Edaphobacter aggregans]|uniref:hypothetical protein n=1 Tax=Edaphobacter aggregans TaxID=570835 RepID=UPI0005519F09|nr:hypothetical protein [Edaphobacter aggregans]
MTHQQGIVYATTSDGYELPIIDITHPAFAVPEDPASLASLTAQYRAAEQQQARLPLFIRRLMMRLGARKSELLRALVAPEQSFLGGLHTYIMKLGPANLPDRFNTPLDQRIASSPHARFVRLRLQHCAQLLADSLEPLLLHDPGAPLHFVNIGGGPAIDCINALFLLAKRQPGLLQRPIHIHVCDLDAKGTVFGANAVAALIESDSPLNSLNITFSSKPYNWNNTGELEALLSTITEPGAIIAASSEGALFEYGSDEAIISNLLTLRSRARLVVGSITSNDPIRREQIKTTRFQLVPRGLEGFRPLAEQTGYTIVRSEITPLSDHVLLRPNSSRAQPSSLSRTTSSF